MNILLTNDDGIHAQGLWTAARVLANWGAVTVVAPGTNYSGYGAALPPAGLFSFYPYRRADGQPETVTAYGLACTPACCAQIGLSGVLGGGPFDLLVSGINHGANLGRDVLYSGTVGAALTAHLLEVPAIAVSLDAGAAGVAHWDAAAWALEQAVRLWQANPEAAPVVFNVNTPNAPTSHLAGVLVTTPANRSCLTKYRFVRDPHLEYAVNAVREEPAEAEQEPLTDAWALRMGYVSVTPLRVMPDVLSVASWGPSAEPIESGVAMHGCLYRYREPGQTAPGSR
jgi:5'-nucleotidase